MKILLTGSNGFTGRVFQTQARADGHTVFESSADLTDRSKVLEEVLEAQPDWVVHLAAISFVGHEDDTAFYAVNAVGTMNLLSALTSLPVRPSKVLIASSANVYGNCEVSPIDEATPPAPVNHYAMSKLAMEHMALTRSDTLPMVLVRPFNYTGPGQAPQFLIPKLVNHFARKADRIELGNLHVEREFNDVRMVCDAYLALLEKGQPGETYNICTGQTHSLQGVMDRLKRLTGHQMTVEVNPAFVRTNEVHRLCGDPAKLLTCVGSLTQYTLDDTLQGMLDAATP